MFVIGDGTFKRGKPNKHGAVKFLVAPVILPTTSGSFGRVETTETDVIEVLRPL